MYIKNKSPRDVTGMNDGTALLDAINNDAFVMHYQPIINLSSGLLAGAEALIRWPQPDGTLLPPDMFIPLAEKMQVITSVTLLVVRKVFEDMEQWLYLHPEQYISINISPPDLTSGELLKYLDLRLAGSHVRPGQIVLELTERDFFEPKITEPIITRCRQAGYGVHIDDFGTGYSNLCYLQEMKADAIKVDKLFIRNPENMKIISYVIELAASLSLSVVAEGIETRQQHSWLISHSVLSGQGWLYSRALPKDEFIKWANKLLKKRKCW
ncbi:EAL domain-containing protein [Enterobacter asburiae]|nr:EAL domain-containing protein [Enterobacter asburiae]